MKIQNSLIIRSLNKTCCRYGCFGVGSFLQIFFNLEIWKKIDSSWFIY